MIVNLTDVGFNSNLGDCVESRYIQLLIYKNSKIIEIYKHISNKNLRDIKICSDSPECVSRQKHPEYPSWIDTKKLGVIGGSCYE